MAKLSIVPLSTPSSITEAARAAVQGAKQLFLHTKSHPCCGWILESGLPFLDMDDLFSETLDFDALNAAIADRLTQGEVDAAYAIPGRGPGASLMAAISKKARERGMELLRLPGSGYGEAAAAALGDFPMEGLRIVSANALPASLDPSAPLAVEELDTPLRAGEVKLALGEYYPDSYPLYFCVMDKSGIYSVCPMPLFEVDRQQAKDYFAATVLLLPPAGFSELQRYGVEDLVRVMERLRAPGGCPWDREQDHESLRSTLIEESYEVLDAIDRRDVEALCEELGDLLLQVVFHAEIEAEQRVFNLRDVCTGIVKKLVYRHPHVFGEVQVSGSEEVLVNWEALKKVEKHQRTATDAIAAIPKGFPALLRAYKVQKRAANAGFDWSTAEEAYPKIAEEAAELMEAVAEGDQAHMLDEAGDLLFACVNVLRLLHLDPELALYEATEKFVRRFTRMETLILSEKSNMEGMSLTELDEYWEKAKKSLE